eukprot:3728786-Heterocapsa_arctica.AAC.1
MERERAGPACTGRLRRDALGVHRVHGGHVLQYIIHVSKPSNFGTGRAATTELRKQGFQPQPASVPT